MSRPGNGHVLTESACAGCMALRPAAAEVWLLWWYHAMVENYTVYLSAMLVLWSVARQYDCSGKTVATPPIPEPVNYDWR